ncbi:MAG: LacI family transcriptional regulator [Actinobacteria bacterium]|nr:LacI family transcriptional regulator [Actinomycetota bacterium]
MEKIPNNKITIKELAKTIGVSITTVSNALNNTGYVKKDTKERILKIATALNYKPNIIARGLKKKSINSIAVIVPNIANPVYSQFLNSIDLIAKEKEYKILLANTHYQVKEEIKYIESLEDIFIDGFIFISGYDNKEFIESLYLRNEKFVLLERPINSNYDLPLVFVDKQHSFIEAIDYLYSLGHRKIAFVSYTFENDTSLEDRYKGYCLGLKKHYLEYDHNLVILEKNLLNIMTQ